MLSRALLLFVQLVVLMPLLASCSINQFSEKFSAFLIENKVASLNRQSDLGRVKGQLLDNIRRLESLLVSGDRSSQMYIYAAQANYSYAFAYEEDRNPEKALTYYSRAYKHALHALRAYGLRRGDLLGRTQSLKLKLSKLPKSSVAGLYWAAMSWAKLIELKQPDLLAMTQLHKAAMLMEQVLKLDSTYNLGGPYLFFAVLYSMRPAYLGGDEALARQYFDRARQFNGHRLLLVDYLQARYLNGRQGELHYQRRLKRILHAPADLYPEQSLINAVAKQKAARLLGRAHG